MTWTAKLFGLQGRMRRSDFWTIRLSIVGVVLVGFVGLLLVSAAFGGFRDPTPEAADSAVGVYILVWLVLLLPIAWVELASSVKRLHDQNITGWLYLIALVPMGGFVLLILCGFIDGTRGPNSFGPSPKAAVADEGVARVFS